MTEQPPPPQGSYPYGPQGGYPPPPPPVGYPPPPAGYLAPPAYALPKDAYTPWLTRVAAALIDLLPVAVISLIGYGVLFATGDTVCVDNQYGFGGYCTTQFSVAGIIIATVAWLLTLVYGFWNWGHRQGTTGQSIGKSAMKFKVVNEKTWQPIGFGLSIVRQIAHVVDQIICYIGYLFPLWDTKRQTLADKIMSTVCVPVQPTTPTPY